MKTAIGADRAFWDASAVVLLCADQSSSAAARRIRARLGGMAVWWATAVEVRSALHRLRREGGLRSTDLAVSLRRLSAIGDAALEIQPTESVRRLAVAMIEQHDLPPTDALQLGAALELSREHPRGRSFVCFDVTLATAADLAGFTVLPAVGWPAGRPGLRGHVS